MRCGIVLLAAGGSARLGKPKQLLVYNGKSLLKHIVEISTATEIGPVLVVLGAHEDILKKELDKNEVLIIHNTKWKDGMASSVKAGLNSLTEKYPDLDGVIFLMCDQPFVTASLLKELITTQQQTDKPIVASSYNNTLGVPALFHKSIFPELLQLQGDTGARKIIQQHIYEITTVPFLKGKTDIDSAEDYENLLKNNND